MCDVDCPASHDNFPPLVSPPPPPPPSPHAKKVAAAAPFDVSTLSLLATVCKMSADHQAKANVPEAEYRGEPPHYLATVPITYPLYDLAFLRLPR